METRGFIHLFHLIVVGSLFLYVGMKRDTIPKWMYSALWVLGIVIIGYHAVKIYIRISGGEHPWANLIHFFYIGPLLMYIGYKREETPRYFFEILLIFGFASIGYHGLYVLEDLGIYKS